MELLNAFEVSIAAASAAVLTAVRKNEIAAVVIHIDDHSEKAFAIFDEISEAVREKNIPIIFLADGDKEEDEYTAFSKGAADYAIRRKGSAFALIGRLNRSIRTAHNDKSSKNDEAEKSPPTENTEVGRAEKIILVADDVEINRNVIEGMLHGIEGLTPEFAADGVEAVRKYMEAPERYALILMDVQMPVLSGTDATKAIRGSSMKNAGEIPIIALTAGVEEKETAAYLEAGMNGVLKKPMDIDQLLSMISRYT